jgi:hypothetical protein
MLVCAMTLSSNRKWFSLAALAIIIPIGLLTTFKLTGIMPESATVAETIEVDAITWNMTRPPDTVGFVGKKTENRYDDSLTKIEMYVHVFNYFENLEELGDCSSFSVNASAHVEEGFVYSMFVGLSEIDPEAVLIIPRSDPWLEMYNLKTESAVTTGSNSREAYIRATALNQPADCSLKIDVSWHFLDTKQNNLDHHVTVTVETIVYNGSAYKRIITPIKMNMLIDPGETFEWPMYLTSNVRVYSESLDENDEVDIYAVSFRRDGSTIKINLTLPESADFNLYFYDDTSLLVANSTHGVGMNEVIVYTDKTMEDTELGYYQWWYIKVERVAGSGTYKLEISPEWK